MAREKLQRYITSIKYTTSRNIRKYILVHSLSETRDWRISIARGKKANNTQKMYSEGENDWRPNQTRM